MNSAAAAALGLWAAAIALAPGLAAKGALASPAALLPIAWWTIARPGRWIALFLATALLLPPLPIALGDSGPHLCLLFAALGLVALLAWGREWRIDLAGPGASLLVLFGVLLASVASAAWTSGPTAAAGSLARVGLFGVSVLVFFSPSDGAPGWRALFAIATASALFACIDFYYQLPAPAGYGPQFVWLDSGVYRRAQGFFYEASTLGNFCAFFLVMVAVAFTRPREESPVPRPVLAVGGAVLLAALMMSYSRASLITVLIAGVVLVWHNRTRLRFGRVILLAAAAAVATSLVFPAFARMYWLRLSATVEYFFSATEGVLSGRVASWRTVLGWIADHPWQTLLGIGYKTLPYTDHLGAPVVADNMYLSLLVETGIAGLAALIWLNVSILRASARKADTFCGLWMLCFWSGQVVQMASGDLLTYWRVLPVYFFVLARAVRV